MSLDTIQEAHKQEAKRSIMLCAFLSLGLPYVYAMNRAPVSECV